MYNMQNNDIKEDLEKIYSDVSEWLKFAEAKHAGALALWTALIVAAFSVDNFYLLSDPLQICIFAALFFGMLINVFAMMPFTNRIYWIRKLCYNKYKGYSGNLVFYQSVFVSVGSPEKSLDDKVSKYKEMLKEEYGCLPQGKLITDYIKQIIEVATVASIKTFLFSVSIWYLGVFIIVSFLYIAL